MVDRIIYLTQRFMDVESQRADAWGRRGAARELWMCVAIISTAFKYAKGSFGVSVAVLFQEPVR